MRQKTIAFFRNFGSYVLALLLAAVILLSALWTRQDQQAAREAPAHADMAQRLSEITPSPAPVAFSRPVAGQITRSYGVAAAWFEAYGCWAQHLSTDFAASPGEKVYAAFDGQVRKEGRDVYLEAAPFSLRYRGLETVQPQDGANVKKGSVLGTAAGGVAWEGENILCLTLFCQGIAADMEIYLSRDE